MAQIDMVVLQCQFHIFYHVSQFPVKRFLEHLPDS
jgi:hypothetical protein